MRCFSETGSGDGSSFQATSASAWSRKILPALPRWENGGAITGPIVVGLLTHVHPFRKVASVSLQLCRKASDS